MTLLDASIDVVLVSDNARMPKQSVTEQFLLRRKPPTKAKRKNRWDCMTASFIPQKRVGCDQSQEDSISSDLKTSVESKKPSRRPSVQEDEEAMRALVNSGFLTSIVSDSECQSEQDLRSSLDKKKPTRRASEEDTQPLRLSSVEESGQGDDSEGSSSCEEAGEAGDVLSALAYEKMSMPSSSARPCSESPRMPMPSSSARPCCSESPRMPMRMMSLEKNPSTFQTLATLQAEMESTLQAELEEEEPEDLYRGTDGLSHSAFCDSLRVRYASPPTSQSP
jgi:hypothetical protein